MAAQQIGPRNLFNDRNKRQKEDKGAQMEYPGAGKKVGTFKANAQLRQSARAAPVERKEDAPTKIFKAHSIGKADARKLSSSSEIGTVLTQKQPEAFSRARSNTAMDDFAISSRKPKILIGSPFRSTLHSQLPTVFLILASALFLSSSSPPPPHRLINKSQNNRAR